MEIHDSEDLIDLADSMVLLNEHSTPLPDSLVYDVLFRPTELEDVPMWDQFSQYEKIKIRKRGCSNDSHTDADELEDSDDEIGTLFILIILV